MCGRFQLLYEIDQLEMRFDARNNYIGYGPRIEIFPTDTIPIIIRKDNRNFIEPAKWGLDNHFDKRPLINARGETVDEKRTFKNLLIESRCLIPATCFYEWKTEGKKKTKFQIKLQDIDIFGMAGLYKVEADAAGYPILRCTIITISANEAMSEIHDRMPVILSKENENVWLDNSIRDPLLLKEFMKTYAGGIELVAI